MKNKILLILPLILCSFSCNNKKELEKGGEIVDLTDKYYVLYMYNYPRVTEETPNGNTEIIDDPLYYKEEINLGQKLVAPKDPERLYYDFDGWYKEKACINKWDFDTGITESSLFLYAKWSMTQGEEFVEPEYVYPEEIISDSNFELTGILNKKIEGNEVNLTTGAIKRLENSAEDVSFSLNYKRKENVSISKATYNVEDSKISVEVGSGEKFEVKVNDITPNLSIATESSIYENKAENYALNSGEYENYHIMLAGSSSMEFWTEYKKDMDPIITYNHGIGGTTVEQWTDKLFERLVLPYSPKAVVYYVGVNNIINAGKDGTQTGNALVKLFDKTHEYLPHTKIFYVLINSLPGFLNRQSDFDIANNKAKEYENSHDFVTCIDAGEGLLKPNGIPHYGYFRTDGLHMSEYGYIIWGSAIKKAIIDWLKK